MSRRRPMKNGHWSPPRNGGYVAGELVGQKAVMGAFVMTLKQKLVYQALRNALPVGVAICSK